MTMDNSLLFSSLAKLPPDWLFSTLYCLIFRNFSL